MRKLVIAIAALVTTTSLAVAGDVSGKGPNGGRMADAGNFHVEFLSKGTDVIVHVFDHDNRPVSSAGMTGRLTVQEKGKTRTADLKPEDPNRLTGTLDAPFVAGARVIISLTPKSGKPAQARYTAN